MTEEQEKYITDHDWKDIEESADHNSMAKCVIGDRLMDENGCNGVVGILWDDGVFCTIENDAPHPNPRLED